LTFYRALRILEAVNLSSTGHNIVLGQNSGGYFAKYVGFVLRDRFACLAFDSMSVMNSDLIMFGGSGKMDVDDSSPYDIVNIISESSLYATREHRLDINIIRKYYRTGSNRFMRPPNATDAFCQTVAECSSHEPFIALCETLLPHERFADTMQQYQRGFHPR
jgi:hypothetical protein